MRRAILLTASLAGLLAGLSSAAQTQTAPTDPCTALLARLGPDFRPSNRPRVIESIGRDTCRYEGIHLATSTRAGWDIASVLLRGVTAEPNQVQAVRIEAKGITLALRSGNARMDWMNRQQQVPFDVNLDYTYDPGTKKAVLRELSMVGETGRVSLDGVVENLDGLDILRPANNPPPVNALVRSFHFKLDSKRFIVSFVLPMLIQALSDGDPAAEVERMKALVVKTARELLPNVPQESMTAIVGFVQDFPKPVHPFDLSVEAVGPAFGAADAALVGGPRDALVERLKQVRVEASYAGEMR